MFAILSRTLPSLITKSPIIPSFRPLTNANHSFTSLLAGFKNTWMPSTPLLGDIRTKSCLRTNKSAAKRFKVMGNGRIKRKKAGKRHNTGHKGRSRVNRLAQGAPISEKSIENRMRILISG
ncbi:hypothetical protein ACHAWO_012280 [Cyclotella atomus]|uniref:50S ribosomal protein L35 n=1 Tax=Cyclotella atomus TaxID=382360 RepID=A0ABD3NH31_9STRA